MVDEDDLAANRESGAAFNASSVEKPTNSASMPSGGVAPLLPSAVIASGCGKGAAIHAFISAVQTGMSNGSTRTFAKPIAFSFRTAQSRARASASVSRKPRPDLGRQPFDDVPCIIVLQRRIAERATCGRNGLGRRGGRRTAGGQGCERQAVRTATVMCMVCA